MKKIACLLVFTCCLLLSSVCLAFNEAPVAVVILGANNISYDTEIGDLWRERIQRRFRFPDYKMLSHQEVVQGLQGNLPAGDRKRPYFKKAQLEQIAATIPAELVFVIYVDRLDESVYQSFFPFGETVRRVNVSLDVTAYRKTDDKYLVDKVRYSRVDNIAISTPAIRVATDGIAEAVNKFKEQLPRLENKQ